MPSAAGSALDAEAQARESPATTIEVSRTLTQHTGAVWQALTSPAGTAVWLGKGAVLGGKGERYHCDNGSTGVVRSWHPLEQLRLSWHELPAAGSSLIEVDLTPLAGGTLLRLWHESVSPELVTGLTAEWQLKLGALAELIDGPSD